MVLCIVYDSIAIDSDKITLFWVVLRYFFVRAFY
jgi:hypothetical protein